MQFDDVYRIPVVSEPSLSPDGTRVVFVVTQADRDADENRSTIWEVPIAGGAPRQMTTGPHDGSPQWSPDGRWLAFVSRRGDEPPQLWLHATASGDEMPLTAMPAGAGDPRWSPDSSRLLFTAAVEPDGLTDTAPVVVRRLGFKADGAGLLKGRQSHLFVIDATLGAEPRRLTEGGWSVRGPVWSPDGTSIAFTGAVHDDADIDLISHVFTVDVATGERRAVTHHRGQAASVTFTPDGSTIVFVGRAEIGIGHAQLFSVAAGGGTPRPLAGFDRNVMVGGPAYPGAVPVVSDDGTTVVFCARDRGCTHVYTVPMAGGDPRKVLGTDASVIAGLSRAGDTIAFVEADPETCGEVCVASVDGRGSRRLTSLVRDALADVEFAIPQPRAFTAPDGLALHGWTIAGDATGPILLDVHGGPHNAWNPAFDGWHLYQQVLAAQGWTILLLNPRGSDGYGEAFFTALRNDGWGRADAGDFLAALDDVLATDGLDPDRVVVTGYSYGGYMSNWLTAHTDRFAAAVSGGCVTNLVSMVSADSGGRMDDHAFGASPWDNPERLMALSPLTGVRHVTAPTLLLHGEEDETCPVGQAEEWFTALRVRRQDVEFVRYPGGSHEFVLSGRPSHRIDFGQRLVDWAIAHTSLKPDSPLKSP
jgi:dipeptidyl aminopeptidase/acylaminoacyl peptidase